jgi:hypothetical protein
MDVSSITSPALYAMEQATPQTPASEVGTAMLGKSLDVAQQMGESMTKMMEQSVYPGVGGHIDMSV